MKTLIMVFVMSLCTAQLFGQDLDKVQSKMDRFVSKTGSILKFSDYEQKSFKTNYEVVETKIRKIERAGEAAYFYQIIKEDKYGDKVASIEYDDLQEVTKAIKSLKVESKVDHVAQGPSYLENKFITEDGFQVGYYVSKNALQWYITLEKYGKGNTVFLKDIGSVEKAIEDAIIEIDILKGK